MPNYRRSYWKSVLLAGAAGVLVLLLTGLLAPAGGAWRGVVIALGDLASLPPLVIAASGLAVLYRDANVAKGKRDLYHAWNASRSEAAIAGKAGDAGLRLRRFVRAIVAPKLLLVGDEVEIRSLEDIRRTLADDGGLDALPFMPEMARFCGHRARVFKRVDKIYDYGGKKVVRRLESTVLLHQLRCSGAAHGDCQAGCYLLWKEAWLKPVSRQANAGTQPPSGRGVGLPKPPETVGPDGSIRYRCQFTQLVAASTPINHWDPRLDLRPLMAGNVTLATFTLALMTRLFNYVQGLRGGYPFPPVASLPPNPSATTHSVAAGDLIRVGPPQQIFATLDRNLKNRGLWFDRDMLKHCGHDYEVLKRVDRIIDDATGRMLTMKTPCIVLQDVTYSGEFLRFLAQEDPLYWREAWLSPVGGKRRADQSA